ncbi:murein transglycosylase A [Methylotenera sp.]|uniref:murein transglycosylase A n=1 Tax=Methylotenera sp. TaxID=2051956 RepID=UPI002487D56A|nr:murein transglycosylase A [Methylotenera sp.]MDI1360719.1 murein transglycosylase A [Methylotenera sp.]
MKRITALILVAFISGGLTACASKSPKASPPTKPIAKCDCSPNKNAVKALPDTSPVQIVEPDRPLIDAKPTDVKPTDVKPADSKIADYGLLKPALWEEVDGLGQSKQNLSDLSLSWPAWMQSCSTLINKPMWQRVCNAATQLNSQTANKPNSEAILAYFKQNFSVYKTTNIDGTDSGLITGYYEPILRGSRFKSAKYPNPLYQVPTDLVTVELDSLFPELKYKRVRGRLVGNKLVPYYNRADIESDAAPLKGREFMYIDDIIDVFYLQVQGSGLVQLESGEQVHVGYADQNGMTYNSIGRLLVERGELTMANASMNGIKNWARNNPAKLRELLNSNPSYVFFRELPAGLPGPLGALGVPILAERVVAIDPKYVPLGAPVFLSTTEPNSSKPLKRLMMAQDTGGAIKGGVRADFYWGDGNEAGAKAGAMKQAGKIWVFLPKEFVINK